MAGKPIADGTGRAAQRLVITARYLSAVGDPAGAERTLRVWKDTYPHDAVPANNLAVIQRLRGQFEQAIENLLEANRRDPSNRFPYTNLCESYACLNRLDEASAIAERSMTVTGASGALSACLLKVAYLRDDAKESARIVGESRKQGPAFFGPVVNVYANIQLAHGRLRSAEAVIEEIEQGARELNLSAAAAEALANMSAFETLMGATDRAVRHADRAVELAPGERAPWPVAVTYFDAGLSAKAQPLHEAFGRRLAKDSYYATFWRPLAEAAFESSRRNARGALDALKIAESWERAQPAVLLPKGRALVALGQPNDAAVVFRRAIELRLGGSRRPSHRSHACGWPGRSLSPATSPERAAAIRSFSTYGRMRILTCPFWSKHARNSRL
jgi:tetratricopeptide (TPR) repeat protein